MSKSLLTCGRKWLTSTTDEVLGSRWFQYTVNNDHQHFKNYSMAVPLKMLICNVTQPNLSKSKFYPSNFVYFWKSEYSIYTKLFMNGFKSCNTGVFCLVQWSPIHWILKKWYHGSSDVWFCVWPKNNKNYHPTSTES